jgi:hypothetical protein
MANQPTIGTAPNSAPAPAPAAAADAKQPPASKTASFLAYLFLGTSKPGEIVVYHHSNLFYWWPVWFFGFVMAIITYFDNTHMAIVPPHTTLVHGKDIQGDAVIDGVKEGEKIDLHERDLLVLDKNRHHLTRKDAAGNEHEVTPNIRVAYQKSVGTTFLFILLVVIGITNVHMRGLWSFFILLVIVMVAIILAVAGFWERILSGLGLLSIHVNMGGYLLLSLVLFVMWFINFFLFDRQTYMIFTAGQVRMRLEIGGGETVYDTTGMVVQKYRSDLFRHWILGFGSGDLVVRPTGVANPIEMPNVLSVSRKVRQIQDLVKEKVVVSQD